MTDQQTLIQLAGGLDLQSDPLTAPRGTLKQCQNFEVTTEAGYTKSGGWLPADGSLIGPEVPDFLYFEFVLAEKTGTFLANELVTLTLNATGGTRTITATYLATGSHPIAFIFAYNATKFADSLDAANSGTVQSVLGSLSGATIVIATSTGQVIQAGANEWQTTDATAIGLPTTANYQTYAQAVIDKYLTVVRPVPGNPMSPVDAVCYYKDAVYAWRDMHALYFNTGVYVGAILEGMQLSLNAVISFGTILKFVVTSGSFATGDAAGYVILYDASDTIIATLVAGSQIKIMNALGASLGNLWKHDVTDPRPLLAFTRAAMYSADEELPNASSPSSDSWVRRRLSREISYKQTGGATGAGFGPSADEDFSIYEYNRLGTTSALAQLQPVTTGYKFCSTVTQQYTVWTNPNNIKAQDGAVASVAYPLIAVPAVSTWIQGVGFDFAEIPAGSSIVGIEVVIRRRNSTAPEKFVDKSVLLKLPDGTFSANKADSATLYPNALTDATYGGTTDTWGVQITPALLNNAAFGVRFEAVETVSTAATVLEVDDIKMRVTYVPATRAVYIRNAAATAPSDIPAGVIHYTVEGGRPIDSDTVGTLTIQIGADEYIGTDGGKLLTYSRVIGAGEEIRTQPAGAGTLLGYTTSSDIPTTFPPSYVQDNNNRARYEFKLANFYADPNAQMLWGANGSEFGFMWDNQYSVRIRTGRRTDLDKPRHLAEHLSFMHWAFDSGDLITSATFRPVTVSIPLGSVLKNVGEPITGVATFNGQTLGVLTNKTTRAYQGSNPANYSPLIITPEVNCFEYSLTNLSGTPMWVSCRGVESVSSVQAYGDFVTKPISFAATPWLQPRLQMNTRFGVVDQRPGYCYSVRNKRQFRVPFRDGYQYTQTLFGAENRPMGTVQTYGRIHGPGALQNIMEFTNRAPIRMAFAGLRSDGSEIILACFENQHDRPNLIPDNNGVYPYAVKLDSSNTYGGQPFPGSMELNPIYTGFPTQPGKQQFAVVYTAAQAGEVFEMDVVSGENHYDTSTNVQGVSRSVTIAPSLTATYVPQVQYATKVDIGNAGECIRVTLSQDDPTVAGTSATNSMPMRFTQMVITTSPQGLPRT